MVYAGFWRRFLAHILDVAVICVSVMIPSFILGIVVGFNNAMDKVNAAKSEQHSALVQTIVPLSQSFFIAQASEQSLPTDTPQVPLAAPVVEPPANQLSVAPNGEMVAQQ